MLVESGLFGVHNNEERVMLLVGIINTVTVGSESGKVTHTVAVTTLYDITVIKTMKIIIYERD